MAEFRAVVVDRYVALGIKPNGCKGPCEGTGVVPRWPPGRPDLVRFEPCPVCEDGLRYDAAANDWLPTPKGGSKA